MNRKARAQSDRMIMNALGHEWVGSVELANRLGWPWRIVARALKRLHASGVIEGTARQWKGSRSRQRSTSIYRARQQLHVGAPRWLLGSAVSCAARARTVKFD